MTITQPVPGPLPPLPTIPSEEQTPLVKVLLALLEHYQATDEQLRTIIGELEQRVCALEVPSGKRPAPARRSYLQRLYPCRRHRRTSSRSKRLRHPHRQRALRLLPIHRLKEPYQLPRTPARASLRLSNQRHRHALSANPQAPACATTTPGRKWRPLPRQNCLE